MPNRGPKIKPTIRALIRITAREDKRDRRVVALALQKLIERLGEPVPGEETLMRMISEERNKDPNPEDQPWHFGTLNDYPLSPEGLKAVLEAYWFADRHGATLTIREAKWIGRLCAVPKMFPRLRDKDVIPWLISWGCDCADEEVLSEASGDPFKMFMPGDPLFSSAFDSMSSEQWEMNAEYYLDNPLERRSVTAMKGYLRDRENKAQVRYTRKMDDRETDMQRVMMRNSKLGKKLRNTWKAAMKRQSELDHEREQREDKNHTEGDWAALETVWEEFDRLLESYKEAK
jgi:hypothetical protein